MSPPYLCQFFHCLYRADPETVSAVQTAGTVDYAGDRTADTVLGTDAAAALTADAFIRANMVACLMDRFAAKRKALTEGRKLAEIKVFPFSFIKVEHFQSVPAFFGGIDFCHIGVFLKNFVQPFLSDPAHRPPD